MLTALFLLVWILILGLMAAVPFRRERPRCSRCGLPGARVSVPGVPGQFCEACAHAAARCKCCGAPEASHAVPGFSGPLCDECYADAIKIP